MSPRDFDIQQVNPFVYEVSKSGSMRVPVRVFASGQLIDAIVEDGALQQAVNVAHLPGIVKASMVMPDAHWGYGFPIGGVAATDPNKQGVISPGGIGFDINCGVRMVRTDLKADDIRPNIRKILNALYDNVPCGVGSSEAIKNLSDGDMRKVCMEGAGWAVDHGFGRENDLDRTEERGAMPGASPDPISSRAMDRGREQVGTLGSGNHFLELDEVDETFDDDVAATLGVEPGNVVLQIHCGSRGFGHQICSDFLKVMKKATGKYNIDLPDKQLCCAPLNSKEGQDYFAAMAAAANYAWCNRQVILSLAVDALKRSTGADRDRMGVRQIYDVCHNVAKWEEHEVEGQQRRVCVHRKGATRAFPPGHEERSVVLRARGRRLVMPGYMSTASCLLIGGDGARRQAWGTTCHGAGRTMSRKGAVRHSSGRDVQKEMAQRGVAVRASGKRTLSEEVPDAYKDVESVVSVMHESGITRKVARLKPMAVMKG